MSTPQSRSSEQSGDGTLRSINSLKAMLQDLTELDSWGFMKPSPFSILKKSDSVLNESN